MSHPDLASLCQLADGELSPGDARVAAEHLADCEDCRERVGRIRRVTHLALDAAVGAALADTAPLPQHSGDCPDASRLAAWHDPVDAPASHRALEQHLESCDACLSEALAARRLIAQLDAAPALPVPDALRARVASRWPTVQAPASALSRLVVRVTRAGAELLESEVLAPLRDLVTLPLAAPALRSSQTNTGLRFELRAASATITTTVAPAADGVGLTLRLADDAGRAMAHQRVFLRRQGRSRYSAQTDGDGLVRMPGVERGLYEVSCPGIGAAFQLDLRA